MPLGDFGFAIAQVDMRRTTLHEQRDHRFALWLTRRLFGSEIENLLLKDRFVRFRTRVVRSQIRQRNRRQTVPLRRQKMTARRIEVSSVLGIAFHGITFFGHRFSPHTGNGSTKRAPDITATTLEVPG